MFLFKSTLPGLLPRWIAVLACAGIMATLCGPAGAALPDPTIPNGLALQVKQERVTQEQLGAIARLGFAYVRTGIWWDNVESPAPGDWHWDRPIKRLVPDPTLPAPLVTSFDTFIGQARQAGLKVLVTMYNGNRLYTGEPVPVVDTHGNMHLLLPGPRTPEQIAAFAAFAAATARHYADIYGAENFVWSIYNEPNMDTNFPPKFDPEAYGDVLLQSCHAIKAAVPGATVIGPDITVTQGKGDGEIDDDFIRRMLAHANVLTCIDGFSLHPYRPMPPDTVAADYAALKTLLQPFMRAAGRDVPLVVDEWGYTMRGKPPRFTYPGATPDWALVHAALVARTLIVNLAAGVPLTTWYEWQDDGDDPQEGEHGYGLRDLAGLPKPGYAAAQTLIATLRGMVFARRLLPESCAAAGAQLYLFRPQTAAGTPVLVAWSDQPQTQLEIPTAQIAGPSLDTLGQKSAPHPSDRKSVFALNALPRYIPIQDGTESVIMCPKPRPQQ